MEGAAIGALGRPDYTVGQERKTALIPMTSLLYLSHNRIGDEQANQEVQAIVHKSIINNKRKNITGALIFTGTHFCQFLEGPDDGVFSLMDTIRLDPRHNDIWVVYQEATEDRRFASWSLAYKGRSNFVGSYLLDLVNASSKSERDRASKSVVTLMEEFARQ